MAAHANPDWLGTGPLTLDDRTVTVNRHVLNRPEMVLGTSSARDTLYGTDGYIVTSTGDLRDQIRSVIALLPDHRPPVPREPTPPVALKPAFVAPPPERHVSEGSFFVGDDRRATPRRDEHPRYLRRHRTPRRRHSDRQAVVRPLPPA